MAVNDAALLQTSPLHSWIGIAADDKAPNSIMLNVILPEVTPLITGTVASATTQQTVQLNDASGGKINSSVTTSNHITAYYHGNDSNRKYPPDVVRGEQVRVTRLSGADKYYWESMGRDDALRKTEILRHEVANRKDPSDTTDDAHTYSMEIDSKQNQHIRLQTSTGNGEKFTYILKLDAGQSGVQLGDDAGNSVTIDSANAKVLIRNSKDAFCLLNGEDIVLAAPRDVTIKAGRQMLVTSPLITISAPEVLALVTKTLSQAAQASATLTAPAIGLNGAVQIPSILTAMNIRAGTYANGAPSGTYPATSIDLGSATASAPSVSPDTTMPSAQRHAASWEDMTSAMAVVVSCFNQVQTQIGVPTVQSQITPLVTQSQMQQLKGT